MTGVPPYQAFSDQSSLLRAMAGNVQPGDLSKLSGLSFVARKLINQSWKLDPAARPRMQQCALRLAAYSTTRLTIGAPLDASAPLDETGLSVAALPANLIDIPAELKAGGKDWFSLYNPHAPRTLEVSAVLSLAHQRCVSV